MGGRVTSVSESGFDGIIVDVECHLSNGLPNIVIVGMGNRSIEEAKERVRSAFASSKITLPKKRITINLAPADVPKESSGFDLAIAAAILVASKQAKSSSVDNTIIAGELSLDGAIRPVRGIIGKILAGKKHGYRKFYIPDANMRQAMLVPGITLVPLKTLKDFSLAISETVKLPEYKTGKGSVPVHERTYPADFVDVVGQQRAKRALEIAAAGGHNVLMSGPPGTGKSMLAKAFPSILSPMNPTEILEATHVHSLASRKFEELVVVRPFRTPHHSASDISIIGGGQNPRPGEISLSHRGVLFVDELPEFSRTTIEALRQPLEDKVITVARAKDSITFPADFMLIATANPCPCGYFGTSKECTCQPHQIQKYQRKLSGPIIDRIDLFVEVDDIKHDQLLKGVGNETSKQILERVSAARDKQAKRYAKHTMHNALLTNRSIKQYARLTPEAEALLNQAAERLNISARSYMRTIKVARTIADLDNSEDINTQHISEALQYRKQTTNTL